MICQMPNNATILEQLVCDGKTVKGSPIKAEEIKVYWLGSDRIVEVITVTITHKGVRKIGGTCSLRACALCHELCFS